LIISLLRAKKYRLKVAIVIGLLVIGITPFSNAYGESANQFGIKLLPEKLLEFTDGVLQVYVESNGLMIPIGITGLKTTSTDSSIIKIIGVEPANEYITNIQIQALKPGTANIILAATGFSSKEIPITVFNNNNFPTQIQMKITPGSFPVDGPKHGYIGVELLTTSGLPTKAEDDTLIKFSTPNTDMLELKETQVLIKKGEYFALNEFKVLSSGEPIIFAETEGMKRISQFITVLESAKPYKIKVYAYPSTFTSYSNPTAYLIIQLQDNDSVPIIAENDVYVSITASNPNAGVNTSINFEEVIFSTNDLVIESGSYWAVASFTTRPDLGGFTESDFQDYTISVSTDDYISTATTIRVIHERVGGGETGQVKGGIIVGEGPAIFSDLPFLTTGKNELLGVVYLEATVLIIDQLDYLKPGSSTVFASITQEVTLPVMASKDLELNIASSYLKTVDFVNPIVKHGSNSALVFGNTGTVAPKDCKIEFYLTDNEGITTVFGQPYGPVQDSLSLTVELMIPKVLAGTNFPLIGILEESEDSDEDSCYSASSDSDDESAGARFGVTQFTDDTILTFSADEYAEIEPAIVKQNQPFVLMDAKSNKVGSTSLEIRGSDLATSISIVSHTTDPTSFALTYPSTTLPNTNALLALQVLDSGGNPVYAKEDIEITIVSNNESVIEIPENLVISKDDYRTIFEINTKGEGNSEIAFLSENLPLAKYNLIVKGIEPKINMKIVGSGLVSESMTATISVSYPGSSLSAEGLDVAWTVSGAEVLHQRQITNEDGEAMIELISHQPGSAIIKAVVNGLGIANAPSTASYTFSHPEGYVEIVEADDSGLGGIIMEGSNMIYIIVLSAAAGAFLFLKRTNRLEGITERLPLDGLAEKFDGIKEKISEIRERD